MPTALLIIDVQQALCSGEHTTFDAAGTIARINQVSAQARAAGALVMLVQHETATGPFAHGSPGWALGDGVNLLLDGAKDPKTPNIEYGPLISDLVARGVRFEICELTLSLLNMKKDQFVMDAGFTPSGVVRIGQLQGQGFGYIKP